MDLFEVQVCDWLMFGYGVVKYYVDCFEYLQVMMVEVMGGVQVLVCEYVYVVSGCLCSLVRVCMKLGCLVCVLVYLIFIIYGVSIVGVLMLVGLCVDFFVDGDLDVLQLFC